VADLEERLALQAYVIEAANALGEAERRLLTALGQATTLSDAQAEAAAAMLGEHVAGVRSSARQLSDWLDGGAPDGGLTGSSGG
jgi:hypothetical protein